MSINLQQFFLRLGRRVRGLRIKQGYSQEDMLLFGFSARHWQQIEAGLVLSQFSTLLRICAVFKISGADLIHGLDTGMYED
jgi:transcriptional regulator with XRE-family HTH domain